MHVKVDVPLYKLYKYALAFVILMNVHLSTTLVAYFNFRLWMFVQTKSVRHIANRPVEMLQQPWGCN